LVEATGAPTWPEQRANLYVAVDYASNQPGVAVVSMSWGTTGGAYSGETSDDVHFNHAGVTYVACSGDNGSPAWYPALSPNVVAVGGPTLDYSDGTGYSEMGWTGSGGSVSNFESQPAYQVGVVPSSVKRRAVPDAAFIADTVSITDTFG